jgi:hypothetical protein
VAKGAIGGIADFGQSPSLEINLVFDIEEPLAEPAVDRCFPRVKHAQPCARGIPGIDQQTGLEDVGSREVDLIA